MHSARNFLVIDTETTGLDKLLDRVVEVAAVLVVNGKIVNAMTSYVNPLRDIPAEASAIHGLVSADLQDAPSLEAVLPFIEELLEQADAIVAHNAPFDKGMLVGLSANKPWVDTLKFARHQHPELSSYKNSSLRYALNLNCPEAAGMPAHRALADAYVTARLLIRLLGERDAENEQDNRVESITDLIHYCDQPILQFTCGFGKHKGSKWIDIPRDYLLWVTSKKDMSPDALYSAQYHLN